MKEKISLYEINLERSKKGIQKWAISPEEKEKVLQFLDELELGRVNKGRKICHLRIFKYIVCLKVTLNFFKKNCNELTIKDIENFERALTSGNLKTIKGTKYL